KVKDWFSNRGRKKAKNRKYLLLPSKLSLKEVLADQEKEAIMEEAHRLSGEVPGGPNWIGFYTTAVKNVKDQLPPDVLRGYEKARREWVETGFPDSYKQKQADKHGTSLSLSMDQLRYDRMGHRSITFTSYVNEEGRLISVVYDFNNLVGPVKVKTFDEKYPEDLDNMLKAWWPYAAYAHG
ncbi:hypothetical protein GALMADRAFT_49703, partial [Galerina marginata CBS 339.88]